MFGGLENRISQLVFAIPAVKGIEFGLGFEAAKLRGSENNDAYRMENGSVVTETNHCGGILGGISNGMPIIFRAAVKPTPSIGKPQNSVRLSEKQNEVLHIHGRQVFLHTGAAFKKALAAAQNGFRRLPKLFQCVKGAFLLLLQFLFHLG